MSDAEIRALCGLDIDSFEVQLKQALPQSGYAPGAGAGSAV